MNETGGNDEGAPEISDGSPAASIYPLAREEQAGVAACLEGRRVMSEATAVRVTCRFRSDFQAPALKIHPPVGHLCFLSLKVI